MTLRAKYDAFWGTQSHRPMAAKEYPLWHNPMMQECASLAYRLGFRFRAVRVDPVSAEPFIVMEAETPTVFLRAHMFAQHVPFEKQAAMLMTHMNSWLEPEGV